MQNIAINWTVFSLTIAALVSQADDHDQPA